MEWMLSVVDVPRVLILVSNASRPLMGVVASGLAKNQMALLTSLLVYHRNISLEKERISVKHHSK